MMRARRQDFSSGEFRRDCPPSDWKPKATVGPGVIEIRLHTTEEYRVFYVAKFAEAVYVLHAFNKRRQKTPPRDIELAQRRYSELIRARSKTKEK